MKKVFAWILAVSSFLCMAGCGGEESTATPCAEHQFGDWQTVEDAVCIKNGVKKRVCSVCGEENLGVIVKPMAHDYETVESKKATCLESGWDTYQYCKREGCTYTSKKEIKPLGHAFVEYGCSDCQESVEEYYLTDFSREFDNVTMTSYSSKMGSAKYYEIQSNRGNKNFRLLHRDGYDGIYWLNNGFTMDFATGTFKFACTDMHKDLGDAKMQAYMIFKDAFGVTYTKRLTVVQKTPTQNSWYDCTVQIPENLKAKTVISLYFHADAFNVDDIRAVNQ